MNQNLKMDRDWNFRGSCKLRQTCSCHSKRLLTFRTAVEFLLSHGFSIDSVCQHGVRYLSRDEEIRARNIQIQRFSNGQQGQEEDIQVVDRDVQDFIAAVHAVIDDWLAQGEVSPFARLKMNEELILDCSSAAGISSISRRWLNRQWNAQKGPSQSS